MSVPQRDWTVVRPRQRGKRITREERTWGGGRKNEDMEGVSKEKDGERLE